jgi:hypothetical protein
MIRRALFLVLLGATLVLMVAIVLALLIGC